MFSGENALMLGRLLSCPASPLSARQHDRVASRQGRKLLGWDGRSVGRLIYRNTVLREEKFRDFAPDREVYILRNIADRVSDDLRVELADDDSYYRA